MVTMSATSPMPPPAERGRPFTAADLEAMPDDGRRYELLDGSLLVSPAPAWRHQRVVANLVHLLMTHCPRDLEVLVAPFDVQLAEDTVLQPDVLVTPRTSAETHGLSGSPLLAVEVLSPSTRSADLGAKLERYQRAGCPAYWVVDPGVPALTAWRLEKGRYGEPTRVEADREFTAGHPFPVTLTPATLLA